MTSKALPIELNQEIKLQINGLNHQGEGVGRFEGLAVFVPYTLPGEEVLVKVTELKKNFARGEVTQTLEVSPDGQQPLCQKFYSCGGCQLQHMNYEAQLTAKTQIVKDSMTRIGKLTDVEVRPALGMEEPWHYRNKVHFQVGEQNGRVVLGFYEENSHRLVAVEACILVDEKLLALAKLTEDLLNKYEVQPFDWEKGTGQLRHVLLRRGHFTGETMVVLVTAQGDFPQGVRMAKELMNTREEVVSVVHNVNGAKGRQVLGEDYRILGGRMQIWERLGHCTYAISPASFFQVNSRQAVKLYDKVWSYARLDGTQVVFDIYCGVGSIGLYLARKARKVIGIESVTEAIMDAKRNAELNKITNAQFLTGQAEVMLPRLAAKGLKADVVVLDPPRKGCDKAVLEAVVEVGPERVVYVSCDAGTLARDLAYLGERGYKTVEVQPVDMFPWTGHVETVVLMSRV